MQLDLAHVFACLMLMASLSPALSLLFQMRLLSNVAAYILLLISDGALEIVHTFFTMNLFGQR